MNFHYINIYIIAICLCLCSCVNHAGSDGLSVPTDAISLFASDDPDYCPHEINEVLSGDYKKYLEYFEGTDYEIGISSGKDGGLPGGALLSCISGISHVRKASMTKSEINELPSIKSFVDGVEISSQSISQTKASNSIMESFGKVVRFSIFDDNRTKSSESSVWETDMYVPKAIEFSFPKAESEDDLNPLCYYKDFVIRWNKDDNNTNGVLIVIDWTGSMVLGRDINDTHVCRLIQVSDTGEAQLPESFFDGIPDTAYCNMLILRGNVENVKQDRYTYKLVGKTYQQISFILIREIE